MPQSKTSAGKPRDLEILDILIEKGFEPFKEDKSPDIKLGELLKMIEIRSRLTPQGKEMKEFWKMIENIRKETLDKPRTARKTSRKPKGTK